jgi:hypothetical protein
MLDCFGLPLVTPLATGVATDKVLALTGQMSALQIVNIPLPTAQEIAERKSH